MKRTTYIFVGVFFANIVLALALLVYLRGALLDSANINYNFTFTQQYSSLNLDGVHTVEFSTKGVEQQQFYFGERGKVEMTAPADPHNRVMSYPVSDYLKLDKRDGVLSVVLDLTSENLREEKSKSMGRKISLDSLMISIETGKDLKTILGDNGFDVILREIQVDSLYLASRFAYVKSCEIGSLVLGGDMQQFRGNTSQFDDLYIDLDNVNKWEIKESKVNTLHLTGSQKCQNYLSDDQYSRLVWEPKSDKAELKVTLKGGTEIISGN